MSEKESRASPNKKDSLEEDTARRDVAAKTSAADSEGSGGGNAVKAKGVIHPDHQLLVLEPNDEQEAPTNFSVRGMMNKEDLNAFNFGGKTFVPMTSVEMDEMSAFSSIEMGTSARFPLTKMSPRGHPTD